MFKTKLFGGILLGFFLTGTALAQETSPFGGFKHDRTQPIEITSDALEVRQAENLAIFSGDVIAGQGTLRVNSDVLEVTYEGQDDGSPDTTSASESDDGTGAIKFMVAKGNVFVSNGAETAQGNRAEYDVDAGKISMTGKVVLTQGGNVISGETLTIDTVSGQGRIEAGGGGRVKSIFTPKAASDN